MVPSMRTTNGGMATRRTGAGIKPGTRSFPAWLKNFFGPTWSIGKNSNR
jgi:hypothetical protein